MKIAAERRTPFPSFPRRGVCAINKLFPFPSGVDGVVRNIKETGCASRFVDNHPVRATKEASPLFSLSRVHPSLKTEGIVATVFGRSAAKMAYLAISFLLAACSKPAATQTAEITEVRIPRGAGGVGFLPLLVMEKDHLIEEQARDAGLPTVHVKWIDLGGPSAMNDALLSGSVDFIAAGPPAFLILWDRTRDSAKVLGVAAMSSLPMYLNARADHLKKLDDINERDKIAVTAVKVSIPSIVMQMYARQKFGMGDVGHFDRFTVTMSHPDGVIALLAGSGTVDAHFTSPPFHQREKKDPHIHTIMTSDEVLGGSTTFTMLSTTTAFRTQHPKMYAAVLKALDESIDIILSDKQDAADILLQATGESGFSREEILEVLNDPSVKFTTTPENLMKYAAFMREIGSISKVPVSWKDLFFQEVQDVPGS
jgi:NitT/TauT family transport system substrate-binding protein